MPNWVYNHMRVNRKDARKVFRTDINDKGEAESVVDFGMAVPMPPSLDITSSSLNEQSLYYFLSEKLTLCKEEVVRKIERLGVTVKRLFDNRYNDNWFDEVINRTGGYTDTLSEQEQEEFFADGKRILFNILNYGVPTWYEWHLEHWGCKWNACNSEISEDESDEEDIIVYFETPWGPPTEWCQALAKLGVDFYLDWEEEQGYRGEIYGYNGEYGEEELPFREDEEEEEDE